MRFPLRAKFFVFATLIAIAPLAFVGQNLVRIARDELKSAANDTLIFDASEATDPDGQGVRVEWDFGDGTRAGSAVTRHRYGAPGEYTVRIEARDTTGLACGVASDTAVVRALARE
jgi:chitodextrinase